jgi:hypothetical protein
LQAAEVQHDSDGRRTFALCPGDRHHVQPDHLGSKRIPRRGVGELLEQAAAVELDDDDRRPPRPVVVLAVLSAHRSSFHPK